MRWGCVVELFPHWTKQLTTRVERYIFRLANLSW